MLNLTDDIIISNATLSGWNRVLNLGQTATIDGSLRVTDNPSVLSIYGSNLSLIGQNMTMRSLARLGVLRFKALTHIGGIDWHTLPRLITPDLGATADGIEALTSLSIMNTSVVWFDKGFTFIFANSIDFTDNLSLGNLVLPVHIILDGLRIAGSALLTVNMPNLISLSSMALYNLRFLDLSSLQSIDNLIISDSVIPNLALPKLWRIGSAGGGILQIENNLNLTILRLPGLTEVGGGILVFNISQLSYMDGFESFDSLRNVG